MALTIDKGADACVLRIADELTVFEVAEYRRQLLEACIGPTAVKLDLGAAEALDTAGVQFLLALRKQLQAAGGSLVLEDVSPHAAEVLRMFNLSDQFGAETEV